LMPALPFFALALAMLLPKSLAWACVILQALAGFPGLTARYESPFAWKLNGWPWRAALRLEPESIYLDRQLPAYKLARMVEKNTKAGDRIFDLGGIANAYMTREVVVYWHSAQANQLTDALAATLTAIRFPQVSMEFKWQATTLRRLRFRIASAGPNEWRLFDVNLFSGDSRVFNSPRWSIGASPNDSEAQLALDENRATFWRTWEKAARGMFFEIQFDRPQVLTRADLIVDEPSGYLDLEVQGIAEDGHWQVLSDSPWRGKLVNSAIRRDAVRAIRRAGFSYLAVGVGPEDTGRIGQEMRADAAAWGVEDVASVGDVHLFRLR
ncbi:MAG: hypothetical protein M3Z85_22340, partial [Acidobacteriota bacterium]|nr:hypothetical protein [Acidobacteriota bacterium]